MNAPIATDSPGREAGQRPGSLNVWILYEDFATGLRAKSILDRMLNRLDAETDCGTEWCRLDLLRQPVFRTETIRKVLQADILITSAHGDSKPFAEFERWLEEWTHRRGARAGALVLSLDAGARESDHGQRTLLRFRVIAAKTGLVLFSHFEDPPVLDGNTSWTSGVGAVGLPSK